MSHCEQLEIVFDVDALEAAAALQTIMDVIRQLGLPEDLFDAGSRRVKYKRLLEQAKCKGNVSWFRAGGLAYHIALVWDWGHYLIHIEEQEKGAAKNWDEWLAPFVKSEGFVQAWVSDTEFYHWQNTEYLWMYECGGRDYSGLPLVSNGLPPPLEETVVDISGNPGRRIIRTGYVEAVGLRMWLSPVFWNLIGKKNPERLAAAGWTIAELAGGITYLETDEFHEGLSVERQAALRSAIYGNP
jgi:hypothetical protein